MHATAANRYRLEMFVHFRVLEPAPIRSTVLAAALEPSQNQKPISGFQVLEHVPLIDRKVSVK